MYIKRLKLLPEEPYNRSSKNVCRKTESYQSKDSCVHVYLMQILHTYVLDNFVIAKIGIFDGLISGTVP